MADVDWDSWGAAGRSEVQANLPSLRSSGGGDDTRRPSHDTVETRHIDSGAFTQIDSAFHGGLPDEPRRNGFRANEMGGGGGGPPPPSVQPPPVDDNRNDGIRRMQQLDNGWTIGAQSPVSPVSAQRGHTNAGTRYPQHPQPSTSSSSAVSSNNRVHDSAYSSDVSANAEHGPPRDGQYPRSSRKYKQHPFPEPEDGAEESVQQAQPDNLAKTAEDSLGWDVGPAKQQAAVAAAPRQMNGSGWDAAPQTQNESSNNKEQDQGWGDVSADGRGAAKNDDSGWGGLSSDTGKQESNDTGGWGSSGQGSSTSTWGQGGGSSSGGGYGSGGYGSSGYGGGSRSCFNCGQDGHHSRECPEPRRGGGGGGGNRACFNCNQEGHQSRDCPEPRTGGGGGGPCHNCQEIGHISRDCPKPRSGGGGGGSTCFNCQQTGHRSNECSNPKVERKPWVVLDPPGYMRGALIGKGKANIEDIKSATSAYIRLIPINPDDPMGQKKIAIFDERDGSKDKAEAALLALVAKGKEIDPGWVPDGEAGAVYRKLTGQSEHTAESTNGSSRADQQSAAVPYPASQHQSTSSQIRPSHERRFSQETQRSFNYPGSATNSTVGRAGGQSQPAYPPQPRQETTGAAVPAFSHSQTQHGPQRSASTVAESNGWYAIPETGDNRAAMNSAESTRGAAMAFSREIEAGWGPASNGPARSDSARGAPDSHTARGSIPASRQHTSTSDASAHSSGWNSVPSIGEPATQATAMSPRAESFGHGRGVPSKTSAVQISNGWEPLPAVHDGNERSQGVPPTERNGHRAERLEHAEPIDARSALHSTTSQSASGWMPQPARPRVGSVVDDLTASMTEARISEPPQQAASLASGWDVQLQPSKTDMNVSTGWHPVHPSAAPTGPAAAMSGRSAPITQNERQESFQARVEQISPDHRNSNGDSRGWGATSSNVAPSASRVASSADSSAPRAAGGWDVPAGSSSSNDSGWDAPAPSVAPRSAVSNGGAAPASGQTNGSGANGWMNRGPLPDQKAAYRGVGGDGWNTGGSHINGNGGYAGSVAGSHHSGGGNDVYRQRPSLDAGRPPMMRGPPGPSGDNDVPLTVNRWQQARSNSLANNSSSSVPPLYVPPPRDIPSIPGSGW